MKKLLLLLVAFLPVYLFAQIKIGETVYGTLSEAGDAATENGDTITIAGSITLHSVYGLKKDKLVLMGVTQDAQINLPDTVKLGFEAGKKITVQNLTIVGSGALAAAAPMMYVNIASTHVIFINDTIRDANSSAHGGAFVLQDNSLTEAYNCVFINNKSAHNGGCFWITGTSQLKLKGCLFMHNVAQYTAGAGGGDGKGGVFATIDHDNMIDVENCAFINNWCEGHSGVYQGEAGSGAGHTNFINCTFYRNHSGGQGGISWLLGAGENLSFINCTMIGNMSGGSGEGGIVTLWNTANKLTVSNCVVTGNGFPRDGNLVDSLSFTTQNPDSIEINSSFISSIAVDLTKITVYGDGNNIDETAGSTDLDTPDTTIGKNWFSALNTSVLNGEGDPGLLSAYSSTDQRGWTRNMGATHISAGSFQYNAVAYDSIVVLRRLSDLTLMPDSSVTVNCSGVFQKYLTPEIIYGTNGACDIYDVQTSDDAALDATFTANSVTLTSLKDETDIVNVTVFGESTGAAMNSASFKVIITSDVNTIKDINSDHLSLYPNPASNYIMLPNNTNSEILVSVCNVNGVVVKKMILSDPTNRVDVSSLAAGIYFVKVVENNGVKYSHCFIKK